MTKRRTTFTRRRAAHLRLGQRGENAAVRLLRELGLTVLLRNYHGPDGEIDIIARDGAVLCFVEVKTRRRQLRGRPVDAITSAKQVKLARTAQRFIRELGRPEIAYRFDAVECVYSRSAPRRLLEARYWPALFSGEEALKNARRQRRDSVPGNSLAPDIRLDKTNSNTSTGRSDMTPANLHVQKRCILMGAVLLAIGCSVNANPQNRFELEKERRRIESNMAHLRVKLLQEDPELKELHERVVRLQKTLMKKLDRNPKMSALRHHLRRVDAKLAQAKE